MSLWELGIVVVVYLFLFFIGGGGTLQVICLMKHIELKLSKSKEVCSVHTAVHVIF